VAFSTEPVRGHLRLRAWQRLSYGLYLTAGDRELADELRAWQLVLPPTAAFTSLTAARLRGWWQPAPIDHPVFAALNATDPRPRRAGLHVCRHPEPPAHQLLDGLRVATAAETLLAAARDLGVLDLVVLGDSALRLRHCTVVDLWSAAAQRRRGAPLLRSVIPLLDARSESPWESVMRVLHVAAGIRVEPQHHVFDDRGRFVARADLWLTGTRRIHEYDGDTHRTAEGHATDLDRERRLSAAGWTRYGYTSQHLLKGGAEVVADTDRLLGRSWDPRRLYAWNELVDSSLFGRRGRGRAYRQWRRSS
jgi:very-short-patch-repair endonuclease